MTLPWRVCSRARLSRDPRFDGKFFIGGGWRQRRVLPVDLPCAHGEREKLHILPYRRRGFGSGLPTVPAVQAGMFAGNEGLGGDLQHRVACAAADWRVRARVGWRGRGTRGAAWRGHHAAFAARLFLKHLGATPSSVAQTRRLHFAKKLIDDTRLPMGEVALSAGFGCVRRFNAAIRGTYRRTPTQIRKLARPEQGAAKNQYMFDLRFRPPYDWSGILDFLLRRAIPGVEHVENGAYRRTIEWNGRRGYFEVRADGKARAGADDRVRGFVGALPHRGERILWDVRSERRSQEKLRERREATHRAGAAGEGDAVASTRFPARGMDSSWACARSWANRSACRALRRLRGALRKNLAGRTRRLQALRACFPRRLCLRTPTSPAWVSLLRGPRRFENSRGACAMARLRFMA